MKIKNIEINNFRQYYKNISIDLSTEDDKNIILIGGKNGFGKTNFLLSLVWCLYGDKISSIDENFRKEIQKEKNYQIFMQRSLNWTAKNEHETEFSIKILFEDICLPEGSSFSSNTNNVLVTRSFNTVSSEETLSVINCKDFKELFNEEADRINFINDFILPIDAAKFVFFDAEKISEIANLNIKDEANFINDALSKILGLDIYEELSQDFDFYINTLKRESASGDLQDKIKDTEDAIEISTNEIEALEIDNGDIGKKIDDCKKEVRDYNDFITKNSIANPSGLNGDQISKDLEQLKSKEIELNEKFNELTELIPLLILTGKIEEVKEHLLLQESIEYNFNNSKIFRDKLDQFIELLFNKPPEPDDSTLSLKDKMFYYDKAQTLGLNIFEDTDTLIQLTFEHDLNNSDKKLINDASTLISSQSKDLFDLTINDFNETKLKINECIRKLKSIESNQEDDLILEYISKKDTADFKISELNMTIGVNTQKISKLRDDIRRLNLTLASLIKDVEINDINTLKIGKCNAYIKVLNDFLLLQKSKHKENIEIAILKEMNLLMHKLTGPENGNKFIKDVKVSILPLGQGMKVTLYDQKDNEIAKESLSSGEKQLYISCLIKAILNETENKYPIFIDTPLGRLDEEHRDNLTTKYYPELSHQVVLFSTNSEITPKRYNDISSFIAKKYLLTNDGSNTKLINGYF
jgi:DNA sulfur modification protein DndD